MQILDLKQDYFELFDLKVDFLIDQQVLKARQKALQVAYHPDRFVNASDQEKRISIQQAAWVNEAFQTLSDPVSRSRYLLELKNVDLGDDSKTTSDMSFLLEQIELREQLEACVDQDDPLNACDIIAVKITNKINQLKEDFVGYYKTEDLELARQTSQKMQFMHRIQEQLKTLQYKLEDELE